MDPNPQNPVGGQHDAAALAEALRRVVGVFVRSVRGETDTPRSSQGETLALLADGGPMTIAALARLRQVKHQSMRLVVAQLEASALVALGGGGDRRSKSVAITGAGREALASDRLIRTMAIEGRIRDALTAEDRGVLAAALPLIERLCYVPASGSGASRRS